MHGLSRSLSARNLKTKLQVVRGPPQTVVPALCSAWHITHLVFDKDNAAYAAVRDAVVKSRGCRGGSGTRYPGPYVVRPTLAGRRECTWWESTAVHFLMAHGTLRPVCTNGFICLMRPPWFLFLRLSGISWLPTVLSRSPNTYHLWGV